MFWYILKKKIENYLKQSSNLTYKQQSTTTNHISTNMDSLPNDILDIIYKKKHNMEMIGILSEIKELTTMKILNACVLIERLREHDKYEPDYELMVWSALKNEGFISVSFFETTVNNLAVEVHYLDDEYIDCDYWLNEYDQEISLNMVINLFKLFFKLIK